MAKVPIATTSRIHFKTLLTGSDGAALAAELAIVSFLSGKGQKRRGTRQFQIVS
jgi:hypothetical protein